jgi:hypothetical protein
VLHSDGVVAMHSLIDGQVRWSHALDVAGSDAMVLGIKYSLCVEPLSGIIYTCDGVTNKVSTFSTNGKSPETIESTHLNRVCEVVATDGIVFMAGMVRPGAAGVELILSDTGTLLPLEDFLVEGTLFAGVACKVGRGQTAWFINGSGSTGAGAATLFIQAATKSVTKLVPLSAHSDPSLGLRLLVPTADEMWVFGSNERVWSWNLKMMELGKPPVAAKFGFGTTVLMGVYVPDLKRVAAVTLGQELILIDAKTKNVLKAIALVPVSFCPGTKGLAIVPCNTSQMLVVGGESLMVYKVDTMKRAGDTLEAAVALRRSVQAGSSSEGD